MAKISCVHCGEEVSGAQIVAERFCCAGCKGAFALVNDLGLSSYYEARINDEKIRKLKPEEPHEMDLASFLTRGKDGDFELLLAIDGLHCAACVWLIENILRKESGVKLARVNLAKRYLRLKWVGDEDRGLELVRLIEKVGYRLYPFDEEVLAQEEEEYSSELVRKLAVAGFGAGNIMLFSIALWLYDAGEMGRQMRNAVNFTMAGIALPCTIYASSVFFRSAFQALKFKRMNMDVTISTAILLTLSVGFYQIFDDANHVYFDSALMLCFFLLIGRYFDFKARRKAFNVSREFSLLSANFARVVDEDGGVRIVAAKNIKEGMVLLVQAGEKVAADGVVIEGESELNNAVITGESRSVLVKKGAKVFASAINEGNSLKIKVTNIQQESLLKQIQDIVEEGENCKGRFVRLADRLAGYYTPVVHLVALATFCGWYFLGGLIGQDALLNAIAVLVITCPCALALAVPIAQSLTISSALKNGIIIKSGEALEKIAKVKVFAFDKTGTLTYGRPKLVGFKGLNRKLNENERKKYLQIASNLAKNSSHPFAKAIYEACNDGGDSALLLATEKKGFGVAGEFEGKAAKLGKRDFVDGFAEEFLNEIDGNFSASFLSFKGDVVAFYFEDELKQDAAKFLGKLDAKKVLLSGDDESVVLKVAKSLGFEQFFAEKNPLEKVEILKDLRQKNGSVAFVGDGINDAGVMALADVSISFSKASGLAQNVADVIIAREDLMPILDFINLASRSRKIIKQNLLFCLIYNFLAMPFAVLGMVNPMVAALAMSSSSLIVVLNSLRVVKK